MFHLIRLLRKSQYRIDKNGTLYKKREIVYVVEASRYTLSIKRNLQRNPDDF